MHSSQTILVVSGELSLLQTSHVMFIALPCLMLFKTLTKFFPAIRLNFSEQ